MAFALNDRVFETTTTNSTGAVALGGAVTGYETFADGVGNNNTTYYAIVHTTLDEWEVGFGTLDGTSANLARTTVFSSTNSDAAVDFTAGTKDVICTFPATKEVSSKLTTTGDTLYASAAHTPARLAIGGARQVLQTNSGTTAPEWVASPQSVLTGTGDTLYTSGANTLARLAIGTGRYTLQTNSGGTAPEWAASPPSLLTGQGDLLYNSAANTLARLAAGTGTYNLAMNSGGTAPEWVEGGASKGFSVAMAIAL